VVLDAAQFVMRNFILAPTRLESDRVEYVLGINHVKLLVLYLWVFEQRHVQRDLVHVCSITSAVQMCVALTICLRVVLVLLLTCVVVRFALFSELHVLGFEVLKHKLVFNFILLR